MTDEQQTEQRNGTAQGASEREAARPEPTPEQLERRRRALSLIRTFGDPALKATAVPVTKFDDALANEVARMSELMEDAMGIGLAATQVGVMHRVLVYRTSPDGPLIAVVNPDLQWMSEEIEVAEEGCLSLPGVAVDVERAAVRARRGARRAGRRRSRSRPPVSRRGCSSTRSTTSRAR